MTVISISTGEFNNFLSSLLRHQYLNGATSGRAHVQFLSGDKLACTLGKGSVPQWMFGVQPSGIDVEGTIQLSIKIPELYGNHDYLTNAGDRVVLLGLDPDSIRLVPVGTGYIDKNEHKVYSEAPISLSCLDYIGYALVDHGFQPLLEKYAAGTITLLQLRSELGR